MGYERDARRRRSAVRRAWMHCFLLSLPALVSAVLLLYWQQVSLAPALLLGGCLLLYLALTAGALIEGIVRPLQTLSNVVASLREGDYSFRARGAGSQDALGELASEVNALADLLQKQRVRSLEATALLARILEVMSAPLFAFDRNDRLQLANHAGVELLGLPYARCFGRGACELGLEVLLAAPDQTIHSFPVNQRSPATPSRWLLRKAAFRQDGAPHTLLLLSDVSLPLQEEEQRSWKRLIRVLGHELSNSLAPIKSIAGSLLTRAETMKGDEATVRDFRRGLGVIESRADALHRFVQSYRQLAQLPPPQFRPVPLAALLERVAHLEQRLPVQLDPGPPVVLHADPDQLEQMFINLLANAVDASLANDAQPVRATWQLAGSSASVVIEDRGLGIANAENLFVPFYTTKPTGSGVGLALAQQIARAHGGEICLLNRDDSDGARAIVRLPVAQS
ncbi:MAG: ATP-binding protein [Terracidiphilus sp.]|jgi:nitrogen fixation/metabolism regulation signal transduction histidine kinase